MKPHLEGWELAKGGLSVNIGNYFKLRCEAAGSADERREILRLAAAAPSLLEAAFKAQAALNACERYFLGSGPQPTPEDTAEAAELLEAVLAMAEGGAR